MKKIFNKTSIFVWSVILSTIFVAAYYYGLILISTFKE